MYLGGYGKQSDDGIFSDLHVYYRVERNTFNMPEKEVLLLTYSLLGDEASQDILKPYSEQMHKAFLIIDSPGQDDVFSSWVWIWYFIY